MSYVNFIEIYYLKDVRSRAVERVFVVKHNNFVNANNHQRNVEENLKMGEKRGETNLMPRVSLQSQHGTLFLIRTPFFRRSLDVLFSLFKPKNVLRGFFAIFVYMYNKDYRIS